MDPTKNICQDPSKKQECENLIYNQYQNLYNKFKEYDQEYLCFISGDKNKCSNGNIITEDSLLSLHDNLNDIIKLLDDNIKDYKKTFMDLNGIQTPAIGTDNFYDQLMSKYNILVETRQKLDEKIFELYADENNSMYSIKPHLDTAVVIGILWTLLASSMLYYVFVKL